ncbi:hypothetical protein RhiirA1_483649 [Rhizophagus irregularis]|uniref:Uncharacterized protein n=1 Tax=Rhizophagus irregularis TaxID=588596 RepID=A0A2N0QK92_9GLOM|nr:hypothetical protein RhiirA1_483649 [Rhizophagus irregularis]
MGCRRSKISQKKSQARFKVLKAARKSQLRQLEDMIDNRLTFSIADLQCKIPISDMIDNRLHIR